MIYFIRVDNQDGYIKIGYSDDRLVKNRISKFQTASPYNIVIVGIMEGGRKEERALHKLFVSDCIIGEWHRPSNKLLKYVEEYTMSFEDYETAKAQHDLQEAEFRMRDLKQLLS